MLTPRFELEQNDKEVTIVIHAPHANIKDTEVYVDGNDFRFSSTPYYLRLNLPGEIEENDHSTGKYDCEKGDFILQFSKIKNGEYFENLDMITNLLAPRKQTNNLPVIEVIGTTVTEADVDVDKNIENYNEISVSEDENEWSIEQNLPSQDSQILLKSPKYGFGNKYSSLALFDEEILKEIIDLLEPDKTPLSERKKLRQKHELQAFDEDHYLADYAEPEHTVPYLLFEAEWDNCEIEMQFNADEKDILKELPNKEFLLNKNEIKTILLGMVDILYAFCYDNRTTFGENTVESGWTINKLSSTLCWFECFDNLEDVVKCSIRRSLCYPLVRNWKLSMKVLDDVRKILKLGKKYVIKCFCQIHHIFNTSQEPRYILNQLYIADYLIWLQHISNSKIEKILESLNKIKPLKYQMNLDLVELETAAEMIMQENSIDVNSLINDLSKTKIDDSLSISTKTLKASEIINNSDELDEKKDGMIEKSSSSYNSTESSSSDSSSCDSSSDSSDSSQLDSDDEPNIDT